MPTELLTAYNVDSLSSAGYTGKGQTVVVFTFDGIDQRDLDKFSDWFTLPRIDLDVMGGMPPARRGEATMDVQLVHAIAPSAKIVLVNARSTAEGDGAYVKLGKLMEEVDRTYPGAVWSFSIGWGCDRLLARADLAPVRSALARAHRNGTTAFVASGDLAGLECKGGHDWSDPPSPDDYGVDAIGVAAGGDRRRRHDAVHRRGGPVAGRTGLVRRPPDPGQRRRGIGAVRPARRGRPRRSTPGRETNGWSPISPRSPTRSPASSSCSTGRYRSAAARRRRRRSGPGWRR